MFKRRETFGVLSTVILGASILGSACSQVGPSPTPQPTTAPSATAAKPPPQISAAEIDRAEVPNYEPVEIKPAVAADYANPYDAREVTLEGVFQAPDGTQITAPGFWDGKGAWRVRFTPSQVGAWTYRLTIKDQNGSGDSPQGRFEVTPSELHGWLQVGKSVDPALSGHYLVYRDGAPFYGVGHGEALNILTGGFNLDRGVAVFNDMQKAGENYVVWWPLYSNSPINNSYNQYFAPNMDIIDLIVRDAQKKNVFLIFTLWDHPELRDDTHAWGTGNWVRNGFSKLGSLDSFFTSPEAWAWQENFYRYTIARWGYSRAIGMWQTVSEINGTNSYEQTNPWHKQVNDYFVANDPYRHPTTASMSGDVDWPEGHAAMDAPQVHVYNFPENDTVQAAEVIAHWTQLMWNRYDKPNWVGEFGVAGDVYYPELFHNAIWAGLASGAAMIPAEWNGGGSWGEMTPAMSADTLRLATFVADIPLAKLDPSALTIASSDAEVRAWGVAGADGGLFWAQDFSLLGKSIDEVRKSQAIRRGVKLEIRSLAAGTYTITPYDTWQGKYLSSISAACEAGQACTVALPAFKADMAFKIERK